MKLGHGLFVFSSVFWAAGACMAQNVLEDDGVGMSLQELEVLVQYWTPAMQRAAADDPGDRMELLSMSLANKKLSEEARKLTPEEDAERYWKNQFIVRNVEREFVVNDYMENLTIPDMSELAEEMYLTSKEKYAVIPESRKSSHILLQCVAPDCDVVKQKALANKILPQKI